MHSPIQSYYQKESLLFQFIFWELILAQQEMQKIDSLQAMAQKHDVQWNESLQNHIMRLAGSTQGYMRLFSWNDDGILTKLRNYCTLFTQNDETPSKEKAVMYNAANQAWLNSLQILDCIRDFEEEQDERKILLLLTRLNRNIVRLSNCALRVVEQFSRDENVLFFILRHKEQLDGVYDNGFVLKLMKRLFGRKLEQAKDFLTQKYDQRGFHHLIPVIHEKFALLSPC